MKRLDIPAGAKGELGYLRDLLARERAPGSGLTMLSDEFVSAAFGPSIALVADLARLFRDDEVAGGWSETEVRGAYEGIILRARQIVGEPGQPADEVLNIAGIKVHVRPDMPPGHIALVLDGKVVGGAVNVRTEPES